jgi:hypothetical protein
MKIKPTPSRKPRAAQKKPAFRQPASLSATPPAPSSTRPFLPWAIVLLVILLAALVRIRLLEIPLERDEGEYAYTGQLLLQGIPPYQAAFNMKFPGIYAAYAVIMAAFGQTIAGIHFGFLLLNAGTIVLVFLLGRRLFTPAAGVAAAAAYALLSVGAGVYGTQAHATHFVVAAALGATLLLLHAADTGNDTGKPATYFSSGFLYGIAILMKQHGVFFAIFGGLYLLWNLWSQHRGTWLAMLRKLALFILGSAVPLALTAFAIWRAGVFDKFWFWTFTYAREYASEMSLTEGMQIFSTTFPNAVGPNLLLWILAAAGLVMLWWKNPNRVSAVFASAFLLFSVLAVCPGLYFRGHYFVLLLPAIALLAGATVTSRPKIAWLVFAVVLAISIAAQNDFLFHMSPIEACHLMYRNSPFPEAIQIADYLRTHSDPAARIAVLGSEPEIYFYAHRRSATGYIYTYDMMEHQPFALTMQDEMIRDVENVRPEYVVFVNDAGSWARHQDSQAKILTWWNAYAAKNYTVVGAADIFSDRTDYQWEHLESYRPRSRLYIAICKRNS